MKKNLFIILFAFLVLFLTACVPGIDETKAANKMQNQGYIVSIDKASVPALIHTQTGYQPLFMISGVNETGDSFYAFAFNDKNSASESVEYINTWAQKKISGSTVYQSGKWVYFGTEKGVKDFE